MKKYLKLIICILIIIIIVFIFAKIIFTKNNIKINDIKNYNYILTYTQEEKIELNKIIDKNNSDLYNYNIYTYGGNVTIEIDNKKYDFKEALEKEIITIDKILNQAKDDSKNQKCLELQFFDGGSIQYTYPNYTILKYHDLNGKEDFVIGMKRRIYQ